MSSLKDLASLIMVPSLYKDGELHTVKPLADENIIVHPDATDNNDGVDGTTPSTSSNFTFSRGSNLAATRVASSGYIEKGRENLLLQSNQFDTTWQTINASVTSGQSGYDGSSDAWLLTSTGGPLYQSISESGVVTFSVNAKANSGAGFLLRVDQTTQTKLEFNISNGAFISGSNYIDYDSTSIGNGWYRLSVTFLAASTTTAQFRITNGSGTNISGSIYIQDAQLEQGLVATDYIETTTTSVSAGILEDMPRLDYSGGASCPSLLLEPQRTNALNHSEYFDDWAKYGGASVTNNATISPEGVQNASLLSSGTSTALYNPSGAGSASQAYTASIYVKKISYTTFRMGMTDDTLEEFSWNFNLDTLATSAAGTPSVWTNTSAYAEDAGNGWIRCVVTGTKGAAGVARMIVKGETTFAPDFYIYGAQLEVASYPTSYIPTYGSSVTRSNDSCAATSVSDVIGQTEGTIFAEYYFDATIDNQGGSDRDILSMTDGTFSNSIQIVHYGNGVGSAYKKVYLYVIVSSSYVVTISSSQYNSGLMKVAVGYANNDYVLYVNGVQIGTDTSAGVPTCSEITIGKNPTLTTTEINQALLFPTRLTNAELAALTTL